MKPISEIALEMLESGLSVIPVKSDKRPAIGSWTEFQKRLPTPEEAKSWEWDGIGVICGEVSENLVCIDIDTKNDLSGSLVRDFKAALTALDPKVLPRLTVESTVNHGLHLTFHTPFPIPTRDLALETDRKVIIETRGEGAYFVCAPSKGYTLKQGEIHKSPTLTQEEVDLILSACESLNRYAPEPISHSVPKEQVGDGVRPFDDYDAKTGVDTIADMLTGRGWKTVLRRGDAFSLTRPDKKERGISATLNHIPGKLYVFSTSTEFESRKAYKASQVYTILNHGGDFSAAARDLYSQGFGDRAKKKNEPAKPVEVGVIAETEKVTLVKVKDLSKKVMDIWDKGMDKGLSTGWDNMDGFFRVVKGHMNTVTGIPSHGKSEWMDGVMLNTAELHGWKWCVFSPENYPIELHVRKLAEKRMRRGFWNQSGKVGSKELEDALAFLDDHFTFVNVGELDIDLEGILSLVASQPFDGVLIDPWNEIGDSRPKESTEHEHIGNALRRVRKFARQKKLSFWIVAHPTKMKKDQKSGEVPVPNLYDVNGSSHWFNKTDNGFCVHRDFKEGSTDVHILKVKFKYYGKPGTAKFRYQIDGGVYLPWSVADDFSGGQTDFKAIAGGDK